MVLVFLKQFLKQHRPSACKCFIEKAIFYLFFREIRDMESEEVVIDSVQSEVDSEVEEGIAKLVASC